MKQAYKITGLVFIIVGILFFLRDLGVNYVGNADLISILIVLVGAGIVGGGGEFSNSGKKK